MSTQQALYSYDQLGRLTSAQFSNGARVSYSYDEMGNRLTTVETAAPLVPPSATVSALPMARYGDFANQPMMVMLSTGELIGWGDNNTGVLANGVSGNTNMPPQKLLFDPNTTVPPFSATIVDWAFTNYSIYVVFSNGWVYSAGKNSAGQLGHGDTTDRLQLKRIEYFVTNNKSISKVWAAASLANNAVCAYFQDSAFAVYGCGHNQSGNLGNATTPTSNLSTPAACAGVTTSPRVIDVQIASGGSNFSTYMLFSDNTLKVAGYNGQGQLGNGTTTNITGAFASATKTGGTSITNVVSVSANGGDQSNGGNALVLDSSGNVWTTGYNSNGELGLGNTTNQNRFTQVTALSSITKAELGGGFTGYGYALNASGTLYTWGRNTSNCQFRNNTTSPVTTPSAPSFTPGSISKVFLPRANNLSGLQGQMLVLTTSGKLAYAGADLGQVGIDNTTNPGAYKFLATPRSIMDGTEVITDVFVHGTVTTQRIFILTDNGSLYASGDNTDSIATGGLSSDVKPAAVVWHKIFGN